MDTEQIFHKQLKRHTLEGRMAPIGRGGRWHFQDNDGDSSLDNYDNEVMCAVALGAYLEREGFGRVLRTDLPPLPLPEDLGGEPDRTKGFEDIPDYDPNHRDPDDPDQPPYCPNPFDNPES